MTDKATTTETAAHLKRVLTLPLVVLYGLGVTVGAGIYVLVGDTAGRAGMAAPVAFLLAAVVMLFPALTFAELACRYPFAAGAARYSEESFRSRGVGLVIGLLMALAGLVAASTISLGSIRYLGELIPLPPALLLVAVVSLMGLVSWWGVRESVGLAGVMTLIEVGGLLLIIGGGIIAEPRLLLRVPELVPAEWSGSMVTAVLEASLLAVFAYIGFEGISNIAEEVVVPRTTLPRAILATLIISTVIYVLTVGVALLTIGPQAIAGHPTPLSHLFTRTTGLPAAIITTIAVVATVNGIIVQIIAVSRLLYGLALRGLLPRPLQFVDRRRGTPVVAIAFVCIAIVLLSLTVPVVALAEWTARIILGVFAVVCAGLTWLKLRGVDAGVDSFTVPVAVPVLGSVGCLSLLVADIAAIEWF